VCTALREYSRLGDTLEAIETRHSTSKTTLKHSNFFRQRELLPDFTAISAPLLRFLDLPSFYAHCIVYKFATLLGVMIRLRK
jgi:hypothetical protein